MMLTQKEPVIFLWKKAWQNKPFRVKTICGFIILIIILLFFPFFFNYIELRNGYTINDTILANIPSYNLSIPIFAIIWFVSFLILVTAVTDPSVMILFLWAFIFLSVSRIISISVIPLDPPAHLIPLIDPISNTFYGGKFLTKDLFYSGHTSTQFLMFLCLKKKALKTIALLATVSIGIMLLVQHVHYTIDVISAPLFAYINYRMAKYYLRNIPLKSFP